jgi:hypothetical protein
MLLPLGKPPINGRNRKKTEDPEISVKSDSSLCEMFRYTKPEETRKNPEKPRKPSISLEKPQFSTRLKNEVRLFVLMKMKIHKNHQLSTEFHTSRKEKFCDRDLCIEKNGTMKYF